VANKFDGTLQEWIFEDLASKFTDLFVVSVDELDDIKKILPNFSISGDLDGSVC
jgi:hypothetical protein